MNAYVPKVGDKVRATMGESVVVGRVSDLLFQNGHFVDVVLYPSETSFAQLTLSVGRNGWALEQLVSVPTKFGAVIRRADGWVFTRAYSEPLPDGAPWFHPASGFSTEAHATAGGFTVLFDGVDE
jgi:hypothetical protein